MKQPFINPIQSCLHDSACTQKLVSPIGIYGSNNNHHFITKHKQSLLFNYYVIGFSLFANLLWVAKFGDICK